MRLVLQAGAWVAASGDSVWAGTAINLFMGKGVPSAVWARSGLYSGSVGEERGQQVRQ